MYWGPRTLNFSIVFLLTLSIFFLCFRIWLYKNRLFIPDLQKLVKYIKCSCVDKTSESPMLLLSLLIYLLFSLESIHSAVMTSAWTVPQPIRETELCPGEGTKESAGTSTLFILPAALQATWCNSSPHFSWFLDGSGPIGTSSIQICHFTLWTQSCLFLFPSEGAYLLFWCLPLSEFWFHQESYFSKPYVVFLSCSWRSDFPLCGFQSASVWGQSMVCMWSTHGLDLAGTGRLEPQGPWELKV